MINNNQLFINLSHLLLSTFKSFSKEKVSRLTKIYLEKNALYLIDD